MCMAAAIGVARFDRGAPTRRVRGGGTHIAQQTTRHKEQESLAS